MGYVSSEHNAENNEPFLKRLGRPMRDPVTYELVPVGTRAVFPEAGNEELFIPETAGSRFEEALSKARSDNREKQTKEVESKRKNMETEKTKLSFWGRLFGQGRSKHGNVSTTPESKLETAAAEQELLVKEIKLAKQAFDAAKGPQKQICETKLRAKLRELQLLNARIKAIGDSLIMDTTIAGSETLNEERAQLTSKSERARALAEETERILVRLGTVAENGTALEHAALDASGLAIGPVKASIADEMAAAGFEKDEMVKPIEIAAKPEPGESNAPIVPVPTGTVDSSILA